MVYWVVLEHNATQCPPQGMQCVATVTARVDCSRVPRRGSSFAIGHCCTQVKGRPLLLLAVSFDTIQVMPEFDVNFLVKLQESEGWHPHDAGCTAVERMFRHARCIRCTKGFVTTNAFDL